MAKANQRIMITKRLLKEAILRLLKQKELKQITITQLCAEAGINRITFYRHYDTPRDVLEEVGRDMFEELRGILQPPKSLSDFERYIEDMCNYLYERSDTVILLLQRSSDIDAFEFVREMYRFVIDEYSSLSKLQEYDADSIRLMTTYWGGGGYFLLRQWLTEDIQKTPKEIASLVYQLICQNDLILIKAKKILESGIMAKSQRP